MRPQPDPKIAFLRDVPLFANCTSSELRDISAVADEISLPVGKHLTTQGAEGEEFILIRSGRASVFKRGDWVAELGPFDFIGEMALLTGQARSATVVVTTPVIALVIARHTFVDVVQRLPGVGDQLEAVMAARQAS